MKKSAVVWLAGLLLVSCGERSNGPPNAAQHTESKESSIDPMEESLDQTAGKLVEALRTGDTQMFLRLCCRKGVNIGADGWTSFETLRDEVRLRRYSYCHYFDTGCLQKLLRDIHHAPPRDNKGTLPLPVSYRQVLSTVDGIEILLKVFRSGDSGEVYGAVTVKWKYPQPRYLGLTSFLSFTFIRENGAWCLQADEFP